MGLVSPPCPANLRVWWYRSRPPSLRSFAVRVGCRRGVLRRLPAQGSLWVLRDSLRARVALEMMAEGGSAGTKGCHQALQSWGRVGAVVCSFGALVSGLRRRQACQGDLCRQGHRADALASGRGEYGSQLVLSAPPDCLTCGSGGAGATSRRSGCVLFAGRRYGVLRQLLAQAGWRGCAAAFVRACRWI